jgi:hypothetical protein
MTLSPPPLDPTLDPLRLAIAQAAISDALVPVLEQPPGSNRSPTIDAWTEAVGSPLGSSWCAIAVAHWFSQSGAQTPSNAAGAVSTWIPWAKTKHLWVQNPEVGDMVCYDLENDGVADHAGIVVGLDPFCTVEANTVPQDGPPATGSQREGYGVFIKQRTNPPILGFVQPIAVSAPTQSET